MSHERLEAEYGELRRKVAKAVEAQIAQFGAGKMFDETRREEIVEEVMEKVVEAALKRFDPAKSEAKISTFAKLTIRFETMKGVARRIDLERREGGELNEELDGDAGVDSAGGMRGARAVRIGCELSLLASMLSPFDLRIFIARYRDGAGNAEIARRLGWSESRLRRWLPGYTRRLARLFGFRR